MSKRWINTSPVGHYERSTSDFGCSPPLPHGWIFHVPAAREQSGHTVLLTTANFVHHADGETIIIVNGVPPQPFVSLLREEDAIEAIANESLANEFGVQVGDTYSLRTDNGQIPS